MKLYVDELVQVWRRTYFTIDTDDVSEGVTRYLNEDYEVAYSSYINSTEELVKPDKHPTEELFTGDNQLLWNNMGYDCRGVQKPEE